jgi:hypothetical protein
MSVQFLTTVEAESWCLNNGIQVAGRSHKKPVEFLLWDSASLKMPARGHHWQEFSIPTLKTVNS